MDRVYKGKSVIREVQDYVLIDIETTGFNPLWDEIIEFSAIRVRSGKVVDTYSTLIKPSFPVDDFVVDLTGITNEMLETAPAIDTIMKDILAFIDEDLIIGHNVSFDVNFIYDNAMGILGIPLKNDFMDTLRLSRKLFKELDNHRLETLTRRFNKKYFPCHRGMDDCLATNELLEYIYNYISINQIDLHELFKKKYSPNKARLDVKNIVASCDDIDETNPLYGLAVCFTGTLDKMVRKDALQLVANLGGIPTDSVTKKTNLLVLGDTDYRFNKKESKSNKYKKAESLILQGCDLKIISETTFLDMIDDDVECQFYRKD